MSVVSSWATNRSRRIDLLLKQLLCFAETLLLRALQSKTKICLSAGERWKLVLSVLFFLCATLHTSAAFGGERLLIGIPRSLPPLAFFNNHSNSPRGLCVDLSVMLGAKLKREVRFISASPEELSRRLNDGTLDFIIGAPLNDVSYHGRVTLITPFGLNRRILVSAPETHITCEQDFQNQRILVLKDDPFLDTVSQNGGIPLISSSYRSALQRLSMHEAAAFVAPSGEVASYIAQQMNLYDVKLMGLSLERIPVTLVLGPDSPELAADLTNALAHLENSGKLTLLREKWLGNTLAPEPFWETYKGHILAILAGLLLLTLLAVAWIVTLRSQIRLTRQKLRSSERRYRELFEMSPDMMLVVDADGDIVLANKAAKLILRLDTDSEKQALKQALCDRGNDCLGMMLDQAGKHNFTREEVLLHPVPDEQRIMEFIVFPFSSPDREQPLLCCIGRDITERRQLEKELIEMERLAVIGKMAAGIAHEINNPLGIILANTDVAKEESSDPMMRHLLETIQRNVERAAATTKRLLNIAMPQTICLTPQNAADIVRDALSFLRPQMKEVQANLSGLPENLPLRGDRILLEQVCINLLLNALTSMQGKGTITIQGEVFKRSKQTWGRLTISDSGPGIPPENMDKIFEPFFTTKGSQGFGLGLFCSRRIMEAHGGVLTASSVPGNGASMILEFPCELDKEADDKPMENISSDSAA